MYIGKLYVQDLIDSDNQFLYTRFEDPAEQDAHIEAMMLALVKAARPLVKIVEIPNPPTLVLDKA